MTARDQLAACHEIVLPPTDLARWYDEYLPGIADIQAIVGTMQIAARMQHGEALEAEGERRGGDQYRSNERRNFDPAQKVRRHEDRLLARNRGAVSEYIKATVAGGAVPSVNGA